MKNKNLERGLKHDIILELLADRLRKSRIPYEVIEMKKIYPNGEVDVYARYGDRRLFFEVKSGCSKHARFKARRQLEKEREYFGDYAYYFSVNPQGIHKINQDKEVK